MKPSPIHSLHSLHSLLALAAFATLSLPQNLAAREASGTKDDTAGKPASIQQENAREDAAASKDLARIHEKLNSIIIPNLEFREASLREAIKHLVEVSKELDVEEKDPSKKGVNIVLRLDAGASGTSGGSAATPQNNPAGLAPAAIPGLDAPPTGAAETPITMSLRQVPLLAALKYVTQIADLKFRIEPFAVSVVPMQASTEVLVTKTYKVRPGFIAKLPVPPSVANADPSDVKEFLMACGISFPPEATASYQDRTGRLIVRNTAENLELVEALVEASEGVPNTPAKPGK